MATDHPDSPSKKRKNHTRGRDQPLFASRRSRPTLQQPPDFLTESINTSRNTSYIPSPSPEKSPTRESLRAKPRQTLDHKSLANAFENVNPRINNENSRPPPSVSQSLLGRAESHHKPPSSQAAGRTPSKSPAKPAKPAKSLSRARTPSPPRGRAIVVDSPANSESSPGRGYAEAYQRIVEEENLAQEDSIDDMDLEDFAYSQDDAALELDRLRAKHRNSSASSRSLRISRKASPRVSMGTEPTPEEMDKENRSVELESVSDMGRTENDTQTSAGSGSSQYAHDIQRLNNALKGNGQAFRKARTGAKSVLTAQNLRRSNGSNESLGSAFSSGSLSHKGSDPSVNVPKAWGRKARPGKDWLSRINSRSGRLTGDLPKRNASGDDLIAESEKKRVSGGAVDQWIAAAKVPLPESSPLANASSQGSTPRTSIQRSTPLDQKSQWELNEDEFTGRSLQVSESPPMRIRNATQNRTPENANHELAQKARSANGLGEPRETKSQPQLLPFELESDSANKTSPERSEDGREGRKERRPQPSSRFGPQSLPRHLEQDTPDDTQEDIGEPIPDTPIVVFRTKSISSARDDEGRRQSANRPRHERGQSHDLLKRLARVSSQSPSPARQQEKASHSPTDAETKPHVDQTPQPLMPKIYQKTPVITGAWVEQTPDRTAREPEPKTVLKTPFVTGGWVETPLPTAGRGPPMPTPSGGEENRELGTSKLGAADLINKLSSDSFTPRPTLRNQEPLRYTGPPLPKSALEEIINDARSGKLKDSRPDLDSAEEPTLHLGDSTIQSLEDLIANDTDYSTLLATSLETSPPTSDPSPSSSHDLPKTQPANEDPQSYTQLLSRLTNLAPSIRASKRQIASLEATVAAPSSNLALTLPNPAKECNEAGELHDFIWPCPNCQCPGRMDNTDMTPLLALRDNMTTFTIPIPRLWRWKEHDWRPRLTWSGALLFGFYAYLCAENWAQASYCHPRYASSMVGYGVDIHAPRPPFVLVQMLYRWCALENVLEPAYIFARTVFRVGVALVGYLIGVMFGDGELGAVQQPVSRDTRIPRPSWGPDLSMLDDEYL